MVSAAVFFVGSLQASERFEVTPPPGWQLADSLFKNGIQTDLYSSGDFAIWTVFDRALKQSNPRRNYQSLEEHKLSAVEECSEPTTKVLETEPKSEIEILFSYSCQPAKTGELNSQPYIAFSKLIQGEQGWYRFALEKDLDSSKPLPVEKYKALEKAFRELAELAYLCTVDDCAEQQALKMNGLMIDAFTDAKPIVMPMVERGQAVGMVSDENLKLEISDLGKDVEVPPLLETIIYAE
ncbi:hypothetical protein ElyMa_003669400 [Elysia marginata]|uniref:Uncharacterized protein n=1 Tax=Elysia marginata TaxID=1093978 RepID=A0AAV4EXN3_9GAST|nr:hypothetical protein ElyMa_003669400 [Elysia marginata]